MWVKSRTLKPSATETVETSRPPMKTTQIAPHLTERRCYEFVNTRNSFRSCVGHLSRWKLYNSPNRERYLKMRMQGPFVPAGEGKVQKDERKPKND